MCIGCPLVILPPRARFFAGEVAWWSQMKHRAVRIVRFTNDSNDEICADFIELGIDQARKAIVKGE